MRMSLTARFGANVLAIVLALVTAFYPAKAKAAGADYGWIVAGDILYAVDNGFSGTTVPDPLTPEWFGATSMAYRDGVGWLHIITGDALWRADPVDGSWILLNGEDWSGPTQMAWNKGTGKLYVIQADRLWQMTDADNSGDYTLVSTADYSGHTSMASLDDRLYVVRANNLYRVNPTTGSRTVIGSAGIWTGATRMTVQTFGDVPANAKLYIVQGGKLWKVDPATGSRTQFGSNTWSSTTAMFCYALGAFTSSIYIVNSNRLYYVNNVGNRTDTSGAVWSGSTASAGRNCYL